MKKKKEIDPIFYDNRDFGEDFYEAKRTGGLIIARPGENAIDAFRRHMAAKRAVSIEEPQLLRKVG